MIITLERHSYADAATLGALLVPNRKFHTVERPWLKNRVNESCIPEGFYECRRVDSPRFGSTFEIVVPGRSHILFHSANWASELLGCVALGMKPDQRCFAVRQSRKAMVEFLHIFKNVNVFNLHVVQYKPKF